MVAWIPKKSCKVDILVWTPCKMVLQTAKHHGVSFLQYKSCLKEILQKPRLFEQQKSALAHNAVKAKRESAFAAVKNI